MKKINILTIVFLFLVKLTYSQVVFPIEFPKEIINKVLCFKEEFNDEFSNSKLNDIFLPGGSKKTTIDFKIYISSDEGIYIEYLNKGKLITTQKINKFSIWESSIEPVNDKYGDLKYNWKKVSYKIYTVNNNTTDFCGDCIKSIEYNEAIGVNEGKFIIHLSVNRGSMAKSQDIKFWINKSDVTNICDEIITKEMLLQKQRDTEEKDKELVNKILDFNKKNDYTNALKLYNELSKPNNELLIQIEEIETKNQNNVAQLIHKNNLDDAFLAYNKLTKKSDYLKSLFVKSYQERYKDTTLTLENKTGSSLLKKYFNDFLGLHKAEKYQMQLSNQGELKITDVSNKILATKSVEKSEIATILINSFTIPVKSIYNYDVTVNAKTLKLKKNNIATLYNDSISTSQKNIIEKSLYPNVIGKYTLLYERKSFNNTLFIDTVKCTNFRGIGGPINAFKSILVPGWGVKSVTGGLKNGWPTTLATYSLFTTAFIFKNLSNTNYDNYLKSTTRSENTTYYDNANVYNKTFYFFTAAGVAVWLFDVIRVSKKGFENNKTRKNTIKNLTFNIDNQSKTFAVGYKIKL